MKKVCLLCVLIFSIHFVGLGQSDEKYLESGDIKLQNSDYKGAIIDYTKALEYNPTQSFAYLYRGYSYYELGDINRAIIDVNRSIDIQPYYEFSYWLRGLIKSKMKDFLGAIRDFSKAIEIKSNNPSAYNHRGNANYMLGDYQGAYNDYDMAVKLSPNDKVLQDNRELAKSMINKNRALNNSDNNKSYTNASESNTSTRSMANWGTKNFSEAAFRKYYDDNMDKLDPIEGIYSFRELERKVKHFVSAPSFSSYVEGLMDKDNIKNQHRIAIINCNSFSYLNEPDYEFVGIILESDYSTWKKGTDILFIRSTAYDNLFESKLLAFPSSKFFKKDLKISKDGIVFSKIESVQQPNPNNSDSYFITDSQNIFLKIYPKLKK